MDLSALPWLFVEPTGGTDECWLWSGGKTGSGYGQWKRRYVHRIAYEVLVGPIPTGRQIHHVCENPLCFNPAHLEPVAAREHPKRHAGRGTSCPQGHPYPESLRPDRRGCKVCNNEQQRERGRARRAASRADWDARNAEVLRLLADGGSLRGVARQMGLSKETVMRIKLGRVKRMV